MKHGTKEQYEELTLAIDTASEPRMLGIAAIIKDCNNTRKHNNLF